MQCIKGLLESNLDEEVIDKNMIFFSEYPQICTC